VAEFLAGLDLGVQSVKLVVLDEQYKILKKETEPVKGNLLLATENLLKRTFPSDREARIYIAVTGAGQNSFAFPENILKVNEVSALAYGASRVFPEARSVFDIGAESARWVELKPGSPQKPFPEIIDFSLNERCAAGTGLFLEKQAYRLGLTIDDFSALAARTRKGAPVAGRCSVFAKSDMIHLQQKGTPPEEIAYGVCLALVRSATSSLLRSKSCPLPVALAGNTVKNQGLIRAFKQILKAGEKELIYSELSPYLAAIGAAILTRVKKDSLQPVSLADFLEKTRPRVELKAFDLQPLGQLSASPVVEPDRIFPTTVKGYLGIDVGSVSTNLVVMGEDSEILSGVYLPTRGQPLEVVKEGLATILSRFQGGLEILGIGTTGSGRYLAGRLLKADIIKNEITSQMKSAVHYFPEVDTIFEIGGQDSKFIQVEHGRVVDFNLNKICAAGTGSFLEEQASQLGFKVEDDFARLASLSTRPHNLGSRCTVFMESELLQALTRNEPLPDLVAGLAYSIARNYLEKVVERRPVGQHIVFEGGVASNPAVVKAFSLLLGREIKVHPYQRLSGAIGAALEARETVKKSGKKSPGLNDIRQILHQSFQPRSFECQICSNRCQVISVEAGKEKVFFGDICERYTSALAGENPASDFHNPLVFRNELIDELLTSQSSNGPVIGLPRGSALQEFLPFWISFFSSLGYRVKLSPETGPEILEAGLRLQPAEICLPVKIISGEIKFLQSDPEVKKIFLPSLVDFHSWKKESFYFCPYTENLPHMLPEGIREKLLTAPVYLAPEARSRKASFENLSKVLNLPHEKIRQAWLRASEAQIEFNQKLKARGETLLREAAASKKPVWVMAGRPYLLYDNFFNLNLWFHLEKLGVAAIPLDYLPVEDLALADIPLEASDIPPWRYPQNLLKTAAWSRRQTGVFPVFLSNYGCGVDGFAVKHLKNLMEGVPYLLLEFDEHRAEAGLITRLEAFADEVNQYRGQTRKSGRIKNVVDPENLPVEELHRYPFKIPYFADHALAFAGAMKRSGMRAEVLPPPDEKSLELGEKYTSGKECHAFSFLLGDLLKLAFDSNGQKNEPQIFFFPGARYSCLLQQYGPSMRNLLLELGKSQIMVLTPTLEYIWKLVGFDGLKSLWQGLVAIDQLNKTACRLRPYELNRGETARVFKNGLKLIEEGLASGQLETNLEKIRSDFKAIETREEDRPVIGIAGDIYTRQNYFANNYLFERLEELGCEIWPSPFIIEEVNFTFDRGFYETLSQGKLVKSLAYAGLNLIKERKRRQVQRKLEVIDLEIKEPDFKELVKFTTTYLNYDNNQSLFLNVARLVDFARQGADGLINVICFNCMLGLTSAAISGRIKNDFENLPVPTLIYGENESSSASSRLEAFVEQVQARYKKKKLNQAVNP
jgi:predicted CoA-substrate-specific enzyme activase